MCKVVLGNTLETIQKLNVNTLHFAKIHKYMKMNYTSEVSPELIYCPHFVLR